MNKSDLEQFMRVLTRRGAMGIVLKNHPGGLIVAFKGEGHQLLSAFHDDMSYDMEESDGFDIMKVFGPPEEKTDNPKSFGEMLWMRGQGVIDAAKMPTDREIKTEADALVNQAGYKRGYFAGQISLKKDLES